MVDFVHPCPEEDVVSISGYYRLTQERTLTYRGREVLYLLGYAVCETSCCGAGGWGYALVPGYLLDLKIRKDSKGRWVSCVEPILDDTEKGEIVKKIQQEAKVTQVVFR